MINKFEENPKGNYKMSAISTVKIKDLEEVIKEYLIKNNMMTTDQSIFHILGANVTPDAGPREYVNNNFPITDLLIVKQSDDDKRLTLEGEESKRMFS